MRFSGKPESVKWLCFDITLSQSAVVRALMLSRITRLNTAFDTLPDACASAASSTGSTADSMWTGSSIFERANRPMASKRVEAGALGANDSDA